MWTPRRIVLTLLGLFGFGAAYAGYARILGDVDGLPQLPQKYLSRVDPGSVAPPPVDAVSPTDVRLTEAFGPNCPERIYSAYPTKIELREEGVVFATGRPQWGSEPSRFVPVAPLSVALNGKPPSPAERAAGEVTEISTIHSDKGVLEFDRPVSSERDMMTAKLLGVELRSEPTLNTTDPRNGRIYITNNQRSADPNKVLLFKTVGPLFYRSPDAPGTPATAPHIWTTAPVQIENRENMPRPLRGPSLQPVAVKTDEGLTRGVIADMQLGLHSPPPTVTADGMKIYLRPAPPPPPGSPPGAKKGPAYAGVKSLEFPDNVLMSLWVDGKSGFPGAADADTPKADTGKPAGDPPVAAGAVVGGFADAGVLAGRVAEKALVRVRTLGPFRYDYETSTARFDISRTADPNVSNNVEVTRVGAAGRDFLVSQMLELELDGPLTQGGAADKDKEKDPARPRAAGPAFKAVRATGQFVRVSSEADQLDAQGTSLTYRTGTTTKDGRRVRYTQTLLEGGPVVAVRARNVLEAGSPAAPGKLTMASFEPVYEKNFKPDPKNPTAGKASHAGVRGPGHIDLYDPATKTTSMRAVWADSLDHLKDRVGDKDLDLFVFTGKARFEDPKGEFDLNADTLRLWVAGGATAAAPAAQPLPFRLQGVGRVKGKSAETVIRDADQLNVWFADVAPPPAVAAVPPAKPTTASAAKPPVAAAKPAPVVAAAPVPVPPAAAAQPAPVPPAKPLYLTARSIEAWVNRSPVKPPPGALPGSSTLKYDMDRARCEDRVVVHQDPTDPAKNPRGIDIAAATLHLTKYPTGHAMTVVGTPTLLAEVHFESVSIAGPHVVIDQPANRVDVSGRGWLRMPASTGLGGAPLQKSEDVTIVWLDRMRFQGERRSAEFLGQVQAEQRTEDPPGEPGAEPTRSRSYAQSHRMDVGFDKPIYFNQLKTARDPAAPAGAEPAAKIETVICSPAPEDGDGIPGRVRTAAPVVLGEDTFGVRSGKQTKGNRVVARLIEVKTEETRTRMTASGPGESRTLGRGSSDPAARPPAPPAAGANTTTAAKPPSPSTEEMKLTVVRFNGKLRVEDKKGIYQQAVYEETIRALHVPTENLNLAVEEHSVPPGSMVLKCTDTLTVSSYKNDGPDAAKRMDAVGGATVRDDKYTGLGNTVSYDGTLMILRGHGDDQATLYRRQRSNDGQDNQSGREIRYDTKTGRVTGIDSSGGQFSTPR